jgi:hypothetical protein
MKTKSKRGLCAFQLNIQSYGNHYLIERTAALEKALARRPRQFQIDLIGLGEIDADWALLIRSILLRRSPRTRLTINARSSLQGGSVLVWLLGDRRLIRDDARVFFRRVDMSGAEEADAGEWSQGTDVAYADSFSETDPEDADYGKVLRFIDEFLPVRELAGKVVNVPLLRQFGLVDNEKLDQFLETAFRQSIGLPKETGSGSESKKSAVQSNVNQSE